MGIANNLQDSRVSEHCVVDMFLNTVYMKLQRQFSIDHIVLYYLGGVSLLVGCPVHPSFNIHTHTPYKHQCGPVCVCRTRLGLFAFR